MSTSFDTHHLHSSVFINGHGHHHHSFWSGHHHSSWPYWGLAFGYGFPYWSYYYSTYPYYSSPYYYHRYPYSYGVYVGYPSSPTYVENNYYYDSSPAEPDEKSVAAAPADDGGRRPRLAERTAPADDITPIPEAEMVPAPEPAQPAAASQAVQLSLAGLAEFRSGLYSEAAESLFAASQAQPRSRELRVYLAQALFAIGEYSFAAEYLRQAIDERPDLASRPFSLSALYASSEAGEKDLAAHYGMLVDRVQLYPAETNELLLLGFVQLNTGRHQEAAVTFSVLKDSAVHAVDAGLAGRLAVESQLRSGDLAEGIEAAEIPAVRPPEEEEFALLLASALE